ncbi:MAG: phasin family protein [Candidatus Sedimenticola sp. PURPLELP]
MTTAKENLEMLKEFGTNGYEGARALGELNLRTWEKMAEAQMATFSLFVDTGIAQMKLASESKDPKELVDGQVEIAKKLGEELVSKGRETMELTNEVRDEYSALVEKGVSQFTGKINEATQKAA